MLSQCGVDIIALYSICDLKTLSPALTKLKCHPILFGLATKITDAGLSKPVKAIFVFCFIRNDLFDLSENPILSNSTPHHKMSVCNCSGQGR